LLVKLRTGTVCHEKDLPTGISIGRFPESHDMSIAENFMRIDNQDSGHSFPNVEELRWGPDGGNAGSPWTLLTIRSRQSPGLRAPGGRSQAHGIRLAGRCSQPAAQWRRNKPAAGGLALSART
jgi:hypothetical protein